MIRLWAGLFGGLILAWAPLPSIAASELLAATDLRADVERAARAGGPLIVLYSRADCKFCKTVKRDYLGPLAADAKRRQLVIREIAQDRNSALTDFDGKATTHASFTSRQKIKLVPVVAFYGPNGRQLAAPIVGTRIPDFYQGYLDDAIEQSAHKLKNP